MSQYKAIKDKLHPTAWNMARFTRNGEVVKPEDEELVNLEFTTVNWTERHFRAMLQHLAYTDGDHAIASQSEDATNMNFHNSSMWIV